MFVVGLTGGIGSGKSKVSDWFSQQGIHIIDADVIAREVVQQGSSTLKKIVQKFGNWVLDDKGELNRRAIREYVFARPQALVDLEQITHPAIRNTAKQQLVNATSAYTILVAPLLLEASEAGLANLCHRVLVIDSSEQLQMERASSRDGQTKERIEQIMANQLPREERVKLADDIVLNNGDLTELYEQLPALHEKYLSLSKQRY